MTGLSTSIRRKPNIEVKLAALLLLSGLSGCNVPLTSDIVYPITATVRGPVDAGKIRTAAPGDVILSQPLVHAGFLELENTVTPRDAPWRGIWTYHPKMEQGLLLYPAFRVGSVRTTVACSIEKVTTGESNLGGTSAPAPVCLDLPGGSLVAVPAGSPHPANAKPLGGSLWLANGAAAQTGFVYLSAEDFAKGAQGSDFTLTEPARLRVAEHPSDAANAHLKLALRYAADSSGSRLETIYLSGEVQLRTSRSDIPLPANGDLPRTVNVDGAAIEILAIKDGVLAYRVVRNFPSDRNVVTDLPD